MAGSRCEFRVFFLAVPLILQINPNRKQYMQVNRGRATIIPKFCLFLQQTEQSNPHLPDSIVDLI
jgi:hypothetical protein